VFPAFRSGGSHLGKNPIAVWQVVSVHQDSIKNTFDYLNYLGHCPHYLWKPDTGEVLQCLDLDEAGRLFSKDINQGGYPCIQIAVLGDRTKPFTDDPLNGGASIFKALKDRGVPEVWPKGPPSLKGGYTEVFRGTLEAGHYSVDQLDPAYLGVGQIDIRKLGYAVPDSVS
jgi:hypothetical protein